MKPKKNGCPRALIQTAPLRVPIEIVNQTEALASRKNITKTQAFIEIWNKRGTPDDISTTFKNY